MVFSDSLNQAEALKKEGVDKEGKEKFCKVIGAI